MCVVKLRKESHGKVEYIEEDLILELLWSDLYLVHQHVKSKAESWDEMGIHDKLLSPTIDSVIDCTF